MMGIKTQNKDPILTTKIPEETYISSLVIGHILDYKASLNKVTRIEIIHSVFSGHRRNNQEITKVLPGSPQLIGKSEICF